MDARDPQELSQGETAYDRLFSAIKSGEFRPGDRVRESDVAERLGLSRTPVREALRRLEAEGIIEHRPRLGAVIRSLSHPEVVELYEMRVVLERAAAEFSAKHASEAEIAELIDLNAAIGDAADNPSLAAKTNQQFHQRVYLSARNRFLLEATRALDNAMMLLGPTTLEDDARIIAVVEEHQAIIDAISEGDARAAGSAAEVHLKTSLRHRLRASRA